MIERFRCWVLQVLGIRRWLDGIRRDLDAIQRLLAEERVYRVELERKLEMVRVPVVDDHGKRHYLLATKKDMQQLRKQSRQRASQQGTDSK